MSSARPTLLPSGLHTPPRPHFLLSHPHPKSDSVCQNNRKGEGGEALNEWGEICDYSWVSAQGQAAKSTFLLSHHMPDLGDVKMMCVCMHTYLHMLPEVTCDSEYVKA